MSSTTRRVWATSNDLRVKRDPGTVAGNGLDSLDIESAAVDHHLVRHAHALSPQQVDR